MSKQKQYQTKEKRRDILLERIVVGLWIAVFAWVVAILFYVLVTDRYFSEQASGILLFTPCTMAIAAILLQAWRKYWKQDRNRFYQKLIIWGAIWMAWLVKSIINRL